MKAILILVITFSLFYPKSTFGQRKIYYHKNVFDKTFTKCQNPPIFGKDSLELQKYLTDKLQNEIPKTSGQITISLIIDESGKILCESILNESNLKLNKTPLNLLFDSMPDWNGGTQNGRKVNCGEIVTLTFNKKTLEVSYRTGSNLF